jgi:HEPN domain-containing protein
MKQQITLLDKAINYNTIIEILKKDALVDELTLSYCAFLSQQSIEFALNFILESLDISYKRTHNLGNLMKLIQTKLPIFCVELKEYATQISSWESESRYDVNFKTTINKVETAQKLFKILLSEVEFSLYFYKKDNWNTCIQLLKNKGYKNEEEIVKCMLTVAEDIHIQQPLRYDVYELLKSHIAEYPEKNVELKIQTSLFEDVDD